MPEKNNNLRNHPIPVGAIVCASLGVIALALSAILIVYTDYEPTTIVLSSLGCSAGY